MQALPNTPYQQLSILKELEFPKNDKICFNSHRMEWKCDLFTVALNGFNFAIISSNV